MVNRGLEGWQLTVLTEEAHLPYDRVALSKALTETDVDLTLGDASMWEHKAVELKTGERAVRIDPVARNVVTASGNVYRYDHVVVATGSDAARLPIPGSEHTHVYRTLEDVWSINKAIAELTTKLGRKVNAVTIGGGLLGLESAAGTEQLGATPVVINGSPWLMNTQLDEGAGQGPSKANGVAASYIDLVDLGLDLAPRRILHPRAGSLALFPSCMWHGTVPFTDDAFRLTVACDMVPAP